MPGWSFPVPGSLSAPQNDNLGHRESNMASLSVRISLDPAGRIGPGKIDLLEAIAAQGSISAAGRQMAMSYRRAWDLVEAMNTMFVKPVVERQVGGKNGGGASLTPFGEMLVRRYRAIEHAAEVAALGHLEALQDEVLQPKERDQAGLRSTSPLAR